MRSKKAFVNIISSVIMQFITIVCGFIVPKLIISEYGSNVNGLVSSITQFLAFITLLEAGFGPVIKSVLFKPIANKDKNSIAQILKSSEKIFRTISYIFIVYVLGLCFFMPFIAVKEFDAFFTISLIIIISISTFSEYYFGITYRLFLQAEQKTYIVSVIRIITLLLNTLIVVILVHFKANIQVVKLASSFIFILRPILQNIYVRKKYNINLNNISTDYRIKQKWDGLAQHIAYVIYNNTDVAILTLCGNLAEVSVYSVYYMIVNRIKNVVQSFVGGIDAAFGDMIAKKEYDVLNKSFRVYEGLYFTIATIVFGSTLLLIIPFVKIYTYGIKDANYIRPIFAYLMVSTQFIITIRQPYNDLVKVSGSFKQTKIGACVEAISNIIISLALVWKYGIVGVIIGTLFAVFIRTIEFMCYTAKKILHRNVFQSINNFLVALIEFVVITIIVNCTIKINVYNYETFFVKGISTFMVSCVIVCFVNMFIYKDCYRFIRNKFVQIKRGKDGYYD